MPIDFFNRAFELKNITNLDQVDIINLTEFSALDEREKKQVVLITGKDNKQRLYLLSNLCTQFKANNYSRLEDPYTREDILKQIPPFNEAFIEFEKYAADYNAYVLNNNPEFIEILIEYARIMLSQENANAFSNTELANIDANKNTQLDILYTKIINMEENKQELLKSLFVTNRSSFQCYIDPKDKWDIFPAKWVPINAKQKKHYKSNKSQYKEWLHQHVFVGDLVTDPASSCLHSWGMDISHLLIQYHHGLGESFSLFPNHSIPAIRALEEELKNRVAHQTALDLEKGRRVKENIRKITENLLNSLTFTEQSIKNRLTSDKNKDNIEKEINRLKNMKGCLSYGSLVKTNHIEMALNKAMLNNNINDVRKDEAVKKALAEHRLFGFFGLKKTQATKNIESSLGTGL